MAVDPCAVAYESYICLTKASLIIIDVEARVTVHDIPISPIHLDLTVSHDVFARGQTRESKT
jgi:hypothetical protein